MARTESQQSEWNCHDERRWRIEIPRHYMPAGDRLIRVFSSLLFVYAQHLSFGIGVAVMSISRIKPRVRRFSKIDLFFDSSCSDKRMRLVLDGWLRTRRCGGSVLRDRRMRHGGRSTPHKDPQIKHRHCKKGKRSGPEKCNRQRSS